MAQRDEDTPILVAQSGPLNGQRWRLLGDLLLGREDTCDIAIPSRQVSRSHARISMTSKGILLEDLGSKNGTHRNGQIVTHPIILEDGDVIQIAFAQQFVFVSSDATMPLDAEQAEQMEIAVSTVPRLLRLDTRSRRVWIGEKEVLPPLSVPQFGLLELLYNHPERVVDRKELIESIWSEDEAIGVSEQALDALIRRLRDRLAAIDPLHTYIITVRGHGLRLDNPEVL